MALIKSETLKGKISPAEQTFLIYKETESKKITLAIQWNLEKKEHFQLLNQINRS